MPLATNRIASMHNAPSPKRIGIGSAVDGSMPAHNRFSSQEKYLVHKSHPCHTIRKKKTALIQSADMVIATTIPSRRIDEKQELESTATILHGAF